MTILRFLEILGQLAVLALVLHEIRAFSQAVLHSITMNEKASRGQRVTPLLRLRVLVLRFSWYSLFLSDLSKALRRVPNFGALRTSSAILGALAGAPLVMATGGVTAVAFGLATVVSTMSYFSAHLWLLRHSARYRHSVNIQASMVADARMARNTV